MSELDAMIDRIKGTMTALAEILSDETQEVKEKSHQMNKDLATIYHSLARQQTAVIALHKRISKLEALVGKEVIE